MDASRRRFLQTVATLTAGGLIAGCQSGESDTTTTRSPTPTPGDGKLVDESQDDVYISDPDPDQLKERARAYIRLLDSGEFEAAHEKFTERAAESITVARLERAWNGTAGEKGSLQEITGTEYRGTGDTGDVVAVRAQFEDGSQQFIFVFTPAGINGFRIVPVQTAEWTPPAYVDQSAFAERELTLPGPGNCSLGATLTVPERTQPMPGVVLVHGNGALDRDETIGPNKTFKDIAWGLASRGIAVLRYDKRTNACDVDRADATIDDIVTEDALTALDRLRGVERVESVFVAGHSFGGLLAPRIANRDSNLAGLVMFAPGPARPIADTIVAQTEHLVNLDGTVTDAEREQLEQVRAVAEKIRTLDIDDDEVVNNYGGDEYYRTLKEYDHTTSVQNLSIPRYLAQGGSDWQVTVEEDLDIWRTALEDESTATVKVYPDLNHHFQESAGKETAQEYREPESHVANRLVVDVASFVTTHG